MADTKVNITEPFDAAKKGKVETLTYVRGTPPNNLDTPENTALWLNWGMPLPEQK